MRLFFMFLFICSILSCKKKADENTIKIISAKPFCLNINDFKNEYLDSLTINGKIPLFTTKERLISLLGPPNERMENDGKMNGTIIPDELNIDSLYFYQKTIFLCRGNEILPYIFDFDGENDIKVVHPRLTFGFNTPLTEFNQQFPLSKRISRGDGSMYSGYYQMNASSQESQNIQWFVYIKSEKIKKIVCCYLPE